MDSKNNGKVVKQNKTDNQFNLEKRRRGRRKAYIIEDAKENLSEYERVRLENIKEREVMFNEMLAAKSLLSPARKPVAIKRSIKAKAKTILPPRKSARIAGEEPPELEYSPVRASRPTPKPKPDPTRLHLETLKFKDTYNHGEEETRIAEMEQFMTDFFVGASTKEETLGHTSNSLRFSNMLETGSGSRGIFPVAKLGEPGQDSIFSLVVHPTKDKVLVGAGTRAGFVSFWDLESRNEVNSVYRFTPHSGPVNWMTWDRFNSNNLITTSFDGFSRITDIEQMEHRLLYGCKGAYNVGTEAKRNANVSLATCHAQIDANTFLVAYSREVVKKQDEAESVGVDGIVGVVDLRVGNKDPVQEFKVLNGMSVHSLDVHPVQANLFLATGNGRSGCPIFDIRQQKKSKALMQPVCRLSRGMALYNASFSPLTGNKVVAIAKDEQIVLFDTQVMTGGVKIPSSCLHYRSRDELWQFPLPKGHWPAGQEKLYLVPRIPRFKRSKMPEYVMAWRINVDGSIKQKHIFRSERRDLPGYVSVVASHPTRDVVVGGNKNGKVFAFM